MLTQGGHFSAPRHMSTTGAGLNAPMAAGTGGPARNRPVEPPGTARGSNLCELVLIGPARRRLLRVPHRTRIGISATGAEETAAGRQRLGGLRVHLPSAAAGTVVPAAIPAPDACPGTLSRPPSARLAVSRSARPLDGASHASAWRGKLATGQAADEPSRAAGPVVSRTVHTTAGRRPVKGRCTCPGLVFSIQETSMIGWSKWPCASMSGSRVPW